MLLLLELVISAWGLTSVLVELWHVPYVAGEDFNRNLYIKTLDFVTVHVYPQNFGMSNTSYAFVNDFMLGVRRAMSLLSHGRYAHPELKTYDTCISDPFQAWCSESVRTEWGLDTSTSSTCG